MNAPNLYKPGMVVLSGYTVLFSHMVLWRPPEYVKYINPGTISYIAAALAQFVESLVIHEVILNPRMYSSPVDDFPYEECWGHITIKHDTLLEATRYASERGWLDHLVDKETVEDPLFYDRHDSLSYRVFMMIACYLASIHGFPFKGIVDDPIIVNGESVYLAGRNTNLYDEFAKGVLEQVTEVVDDKIRSQEKYLKDYFKLDIPIIFNYVLEKAKSRDDIFSVAMELRYSKEARAFREQLTLLDIAASVDDRKGVLQITEEVDDKIKSLSKKLGQPTLDFYVGVPLSVSQNIGQIAKWVQDAVVHRRKRYLIFLEQLYESGKQARSIRRHLGKLL